MPEERRDRFSLMLAWASLGLYLSSKESLRYTTLWHFDEKPLCLVAIICLLFLFAFIILMKITQSRSPVFSGQKPLILLLMGLQTAGMIVHLLHTWGFYFPAIVIDLSILGHELSLLLLLLASHYLYSFPPSKALSGFAYGVACSGALQVFLVFLNLQVAQIFAVSFSFLATILLFSSQFFSKESPPGRKSAFEDKGIEDKETVSLVPENQSPVKASNFKISMLMIFLVSLILMGAYSEWQSQQDASTTSALIQLCSGLGLIAAAVFFTILRNSLNFRSLFFLCQVIVLPVTIGSLYLSSIFTGPGISVSLLLFDLSYGMILFTVWLAPFIYTARRKAYVLVAGFFAHKMGWVVGISITRSFPWSNFIWIGTTIIVLAFLLLIGLSIALLVKHNQATENTTTPNTFDLEEAIKILSERYSLTPREKEVFTLLAKGRTAQYLARDLYLSEATVRTHIAHIYRKLSINSQQTLIDMVEEACKKHEAL